MRLIEKYLFILALSLCLGLTCSSCESEEPDTDYRLYGTWTLTGDEYGALPELAYCEFYFRSSGGGTYSCYDEYGYWQKYPISWWADGTTLSVDLPGETWMYDYTVTGGWLYLYPYDGSPYLVFMAY